jgi:hypothetical protein
MPNESPPLRTVSCVSAMPGSSCTAVIATAAAYIAANAIAARARRGDRTSESSA